MASLSPAMRNRRVGLMAALGACAMLAAGYASVPLYRLFCAATGYGGTPQRATAAQAAAAHRAGAASISVRFDANVEPGMAWQFAPRQTTLNVPLGERTLAVYTATNLSHQPMTGTASFNVAPAEAARYFTKIACFCFTRQTLQPGQTQAMPVSFYVDPQLAQDPDLRNLQQITLSYTFHPAPPG
jgi:cytochrome c oxidase assembly protein subunit 11